MGIGCLNFDGKMTKLAFFLFCGLFGSSLAIFGGRDTTRNQYPFVVAIQEKITKQIICMGAIKNNFWIVTSAGCCQASTMMPQICVLLPESIISQDLKLTGNIETWKICSSIL